MAGEPALIRLLRESLEEELPLGVASGVLFRALSAWGPRIPSTFIEVVELLDGPLFDALAQRVGAERAGELKGLLERRLRLAELPTGTFASSELRHFEENTTRALPKMRGAVPLRVASGTPTLAVLVASTLGPTRVRGAQADDSDALLLVDATDPPRWSDAKMRAIARGAPLTLLWGADTDAGRHLSSMLVSEGVTPMQFDTEHGVEPLLDVLRSRAG